MLRRRFFDANQDWSEYNFIDLCAGTGAMGLEAWSRGACKVLLVERARSVVTTTGKNLDLVRERYPQELEERPVYLQNLDAAKFTGAFKSEYASWSEEQQIKTWIFLDPPYDAHPLYKWFLRTYLQEENWFKGKILVESDTQKRVLGGNGGSREESKLLKFILRAPVILLILSVNLFSILFPLW